LEIFESVIELDKVGVTNLDVILVASTSLTSIQVLLLLDSPLHLLLEELKSVG